LPSHVYRASLFSLVMKVDLLVAIPKDNLVSAFRDCVIAAPILSIRSVEALGSLIGCNLKLFFSAGIINMGIGARCEY
jgi:hypothetical protein